MVFEVNLDQELKGAFIIEVVSHEALTRLLIEKGIFTKEEFLEMVKVVNRDRKRKPKLGKAGFDYPDIVKCHGEFLQVGVPLTHGILTHSTIVL